MIFAQSFEIPAIVYAKILQDMYLCYMHFQKLQGLEKKKYPSEAKSLPRLE